MFFVPKQTTDKGSHRIGGPSTESRSRIVGRSGLKPIATEVDAPPIAPGYTQKETSENAELKAGFTKRIVREDSKCLQC